MNIQQREGKPSRDQVIRETEDIPMDPKSQICPELEMLRRYLILKA
jgi:hypothetical protein